MSLSIDLFLSAIVKNVVFPARPGSVNSDKANKECLKAYKSKILSLLVPIAAGYNVIFEDSHRLLLKVNT